MDKFIEIVAMCDESGHWYLVPKDKAPEFRRLSEEIILSDFDQDLIADFDSKFTQYRTGGDINGTQLYIKVDN